MFSQFDSNYFKKVNKVLLPLVWIGLFITTISIFFPLREQSLDLKHALLLTPEKLPFWAM